MTKTHIFQMGWVVCSTTKEPGKVLDEKVKTDIRSVLEASKLVGLDFKVPPWDLWGFPVRFFVSKNGLL